MEIFCLAPKTSNPPDKSAPKAKAPEPRHPVAKPSQAPTTQPPKPLNAPVVPSKAPVKQVAQPSPCSTAYRGPELSPGSPPHSGSFMHSMPRNGQAKGDLRLDTLHFAKKGGDSGPSLVAKDWPRASFSKVNLPADDDEIVLPKDGLFPKPKRAFSPVGSKPAKLAERINFMPNRNALTLRKRPAANYSSKLILRPFACSQEDFNSIVVQAKYDDDATRTPRGNPLLPSANRGLSSENDSPSTQGRQNRAQGHL